MSHPYSEGYAKKFISRIAKGDFVTADDGYVAFWPHERNGAFGAFHLRIIADHIDALNAGWDAQIQKDLTQP